KVDEGRFFLPDAEEGRREAIVTTVLDARPLAVIRLGTPSIKPMLTAFALGGVFILTTYHLYGLALASGVLTLGLILWWLWTGTAEIPEKRCKPIGHGIDLPLYISGISSPGWWAMFITMMADATAFSGLVFGYFFFWTRHEDFPPTGMADMPGIFWPMVALAVALASWALTVAAREANARGHVPVARLLLLIGIGASLYGLYAGVAGPWLSGLDPEAHSYPAIVWTLAIWMVVHSGVAAIMQGYALARSIAGRMTAEHDAEIRNITVYLHFFALEAVVAYATIGLFPEVA
ncbi:MAG: cytochrome ubiquinol oxidase subunit I, partial [Sphingobium sp.]